MHRAGKEGHAGHRRHVGNGGEPLFMDTTHRKQKYGMKLVTVHVIDEENSGMLLSQHQVQCKCFVLQIRGGHAIEYNVPSDQNRISKLAHSAPSWLPFGCHKTGL
jgi:hypothetical protein